MSTNPVEEMTDAEVEQAWFQAECAMRETLQTYRVAYDRFSDVNREYCKRWRRLLARIPHERRLR